MKDLRILHDIIKENNIEVVHCHHRMAALYMQFYTMLRKIPVVYSLHLADIPSDFIHRSMTFVGDCAIGVSSDVSRFLIEKLCVPKEKVVTVLNGVNIKELTPLNEQEIQNLRSKWNIKDGQFVFVMHSRIAEVKNHLLVVEAVANLPQEIKKKTVVVCSGEANGSYYENVLSTIKKHNLMDNFRFVGWTKTRDILGIADFLIAPSFNEGFLLSASEAFLMKVPVMRSRTAGFEDQKYCYPISTTDPKDVTTLIVEYAKHPEKFSDNIRTAYSFALENLTVEKMTMNLVKQYRSVCKT